MQTKISQEYVSGSKRRVVLTEIGFEESNACAGINGVERIILDEINAIQDDSRMKKIQRTEQEWKDLLSPFEYVVLRQEGTEQPGSSPLNAEYRKGVFKCAGCGLDLFRSEAKFDSGTGWPSFYEAIEGSLDTRKDFKLVLPRTEYHCARCGSHHGHLFNDGLPPTKKRYCSNGVALRFQPDKADEPG